MQITRAISKESTRKDSGAVLILCVSLRLCVFARGILSPVVFVSGLGNSRQEGVKEGCEITGGEAGPDAEADERGDFPGMKERARHDPAPVHAAIGISVCLKRVRIEVKW